MTVTLFISILTLGATLTSVLTEAIKKAYQNANKEYSANIIALVDAIAIGGGGTAVAYMLLGIDWTVNNIICMVLMAFVVWLGSMLGFDKILQTASQVAEVIAVKEKKEKEEEKAEEIKKDEDDLK